MLPLLYYSGRTCCHSFMFLPATISNPKHQPSPIPTMSCLSFSIMLSYGRTRRKYQKDTIAPTPKASPPNCSATAPAPTIATPPQHSTILTPSQICLKQESHNLPLLTSPPDSNHNSDTHIVLLPDLSCPPSSVWNLTPGLLCRISHSLSYSQLAQSGYTIKCP